MRGKFCDRMSSVPVESHLQAQVAAEKAQEGRNSVDSGRGLTYGEYLHLGPLLSSQHLLSSKHAKTVPAEHLFIVTHQAYELWFKQILYDLDIIRHAFMAPTVDETLTLRIVNGLDRCVRIMKLLVDQVLILETMYPLDFVEFRKYLSPASGFQSLQFRLIETKLGVKRENRVKYNAAHYQSAFRAPEDQARLAASEEEPSLCSLVEKWLERTPGLDSTNFWPQYQRGIEAYLRDAKLENDLDPAEWEKTKLSYRSILDEDLHHNLVQQGERRLSHTALKGALLISFYRDQPRFSQPYQILSLLMDIDSLLTKWRYNHVMLVQRMLGSKHGSGGSSGYLYLRSTISDRYKVFLDLFNLSTWLLPRQYIPRLDPDLQLRLTHQAPPTPEESDTDDIFPGFNA